MTEGTPGPEARAGGVGTAARKVGKGKGTKGKGKEGADITEAAGSVQPRGVSKTAGQKRRKNFSLRTVKLHLLGHYPRVIRNFGTTDSYSTQVVRYFI